VRIISGKNKGRHIVAPNNLPVRPTTDLAKESLFNILNNIVSLGESDVLDLFAGTGNISYEFASRESKSVTAVDSNRICTQFIYQTATKLNFKNLFVIQSDVKAFIRNSRKTWDIIFADPPYDMEGLDKIPALIFEHHLLNPEGIFILEHNKRIDFSMFSGFSDHRRYGKVNFTFFMNQP
jgi:16S rRNA (guanine(966)-N(2))-methyltransferase RsmD